MLRHVTGGHLPFEADITKHIAYERTNLITVAVNNILTSETIPQGHVTYKNNTKLYPKGFYEVSGNFDFFNYAGIHRSVVLYAVPRSYINDITITTEVSGQNGIIHYEIQTNENINSAKCIAELYDKNAQLVGKSEGFSSSISVENASLWWPYNMHAQPGYLYELRVMLQNSNKTTLDTYTLKIGIRSVSLTKTNFFINGEKFYFKGFGKHEDANVSIFSICQNEIILLIYLLCNVVFVTFPKQGPNKKCY